MPAMGEHSAATSPQSVERNSLDDNETDPCCNLKNTLENERNNLPTNFKPRVCTGCPKAHDPPQMPHRPLSVEKQQGGKAYHNDVLTALDAHIPKDDGIMHDTGIESRLSDLEIYNIT
jgi:hypothetical protein